MLKTLLVGWLLYSSMVAGLLSPSNSIFSTRNIREPPERITRFEILSVGRTSAAHWPINQRKDEKVTAHSASGRRRTLWSRLFMRRGRPPGRQFATRRRKMWCFLVAVLAYFRGPSFAPFDLDLNVAHAGMTVKFNSLKVEATVNSNPELLFPLSFTTTTKQKSEVARPKKHIAVDKKKSRGTFVENAASMKEKMMLVTEKHTTHLSKLKSGGSIMVAAAGGFLVGKMARKDSICGSSSHGSTNTAVLEEEVKKEQARSLVAEIYVKNSLKQQQNGTEPEEFKEEVEADTGSEIEAPMEVREVGSLKGDTLTEQQNVTMPVATAQLVQSETINIGNVTMSVNTTGILEVPGPVTVEQIEKPMDLKSLYFVDVDNQNSLTNETSSNLPNTVFTTEPESLPESETDSNIDGITNTVLSQTATDLRLNMTSPQKLEAPQTNEISEDMEHF